MRNKAFTLIELIVVIVLLGILAATALPRYVDFSRDAHLATIKQYAASLTASANLARSKWITSGQPSSLNYIGGANNDLSFSSKGYPNGATNGSSAAIALTGANSTTKDASCMNLFINLVPNVSVTQNVSPAVCISTQTNAELCAHYAANSHCEYVYRSDNSTVSNYYSILYPLTQFNGFGNPDEGEVWIFSAGDSDRVY